MKHKSVLMKTRNITYNTFVYCKHSVQHFCSVLGLLSLLMCRLQVLKLNFQQRNLIITNVNLKFYELLPKCHRTIFAEHSDLVVHWVKVQSIWWPQTWTKLKDVSELWQYLAEKWDKLVQFVIAVILRTNNNYKI